MLDGLGLGPSDGQLSFSPCRSAVAGSWLVHFQEWRVGTPEVPPSFWVALLFVSLPVCAVLLLASYHCLLEKPLEKV